MTTKQDRKMEKIKKEVKERHDLIRKLMFSGNTVDEFISRAMSEAIFYDLVENTDSMMWDTICKLFSHRIDRYREK